MTRIPLETWAIGYLLRHLLIHYHLPLISLVTVSYVSPFFVLFCVCLFNFSASWLIYHWGIYCLLGIFFFSFFFFLLAGVAGENIFLLVCCQILGIVCQQVGKYFTVHIRSFAMSSIPTMAILLAMVTVFVRLFIIGDLSWRDIAV